MNANLLNYHSVMDGPSPEEKQNLQERLKGLPNTAIVTFLTLLEARFLSHQSEYGVPTEMLQIMEGRKQELKDLKDSIIQAHAGFADEQEPPEVHQEDG